MGITGSVYAMLSHGLTTGGLFLAIGVLYERRHTRRLAEFGGLWSQMPVFAGVFLVVTLGSAGLPGLSGFIGEFLTIFGTFISDNEGLLAPRLMAALAATGVIFGAVYLLYMFQRMMFGPITREANRKLEDLSGREIAVFTPIVIMIFVMGLYPRPFLQVTEKAVDRFMLTYQNRLENSLPEPAPPPTPGPSMAPAGPQAGPQGGQQ
jgi:NADH-quinone oxidoreductase subunit M